jgi:hypothetical protein
MLHSAYAIPIRDSGSDGGRRWFRYTRHDSSLAECWKKVANFVLASLRKLTVPQGYVSLSQLAAALLDALFEHSSTIS